MYVETGIRDPHNFLVFTLLCIDLNNFCSAEKRLPKQYTELAVAVRPCIKLTSLQLSVWKINSHYIVKCAKKLLKVFPNQGCTLKNLIHATGFSARQPDSGPHTAALSAAAGTGSQLRQVEQLIHILITKMRHRCTY